MSPALFVVRMIAAERFLFLQVWKQLDKNTAVLVELFFISRPLLLVVSCQATQQRWQSTANASLWHRSQGAVITKLHSVGQTPQHYLKHTIVYHHKRDMHSVAAQIFKIGYHILFEWCGGSCQNLAQLNIQALVPSTFWDHCIIWYWNSASSELFSSAMYSFPHSLQWKCFQGIVKRNWLQWSALPRWNLLSNTWLHQYRLPTWNTWLSCQVFLHLKTYWWALRVASLSNPTFITAESKFPVLHFMGATVNV